MRHDTVDAHRPKRSLLAGFDEGWIWAIHLASGRGSAAQTHSVALPFGATEWPQRTHLVLDEANTTLKIAQGDSFAIAVKVRPGDRGARIGPGGLSVRRRDREHRAAPQPAWRRVPRADRAGQPAVPVQRGRRRRRVDRSAISRSASSRRRPSSRSTVRVVPPPYTGLAAQTLAPGQSQFRALEGTRLELDAEATKPLEAAELRIGDAPAGTAVAFDSSRTRFGASITVKSSVQLLVPHEGYRGLLQSRGGPVRRPQLPRRGPARRDRRAQDRSRRAGRGDRAGQDPGGR